MFFCASYGAGGFVKSNGNTTYRRVRKRFNIGRVVLRFGSLLIGALLITSLIPVLSAGKSGDVSLQVPAGQEPFATDYLSVAGEDYLSARNYEPELVPEDVLAEMTNQSFIPQEEIVDDNALLEKNTFEIIEQFDDQGIPEELLALSEFELDSTTVYVSVGDANIRTGPSGSDEVICKVFYSNRLKRVGIGSAWSRVQIDDVSEGYILSSLITTSFIATPTPTPSPTPTPTPKPKITESTASGTYYAKGQLNVRSGPGTGYTLLKTLSAGDPVEVVARTSNGWFKTVVGSYVLASLVSSSKPGSGASSGTVTSAPAVTPADPSSSDIATYAQSFLGVPYVWAGSSTSGMDCSGFVSYVYANYYNMYLPHQSAKIEALGTPVSESEIQPGDVVCYSYGGKVCDHVALYIGGGMIVHASSRNGKVVLAYFSMGSVTSIRRLL